MKIKKYIILFLISVIIFPINANALTGTVEINCDKTSIFSGDEIKCVLFGENFIESISQFQADVQLGDGLSLVSALKDSAWEGSADGGDIDLYTDKNKSGKINFATITVKGGDVSSNKNVKITLDNIIIGDANFVETKFDDVSINIKILSNNNSDNNENNDNENNEEEDNENNNGNSENKENVSENPKTGSFSILFLISIVFIFLILVVFYCFMWEKKENV